LKLIAVSFQHDAHELTSGTDASLCEELLRRSFGRPFGDADAIGEHF